MNSFQAWLSVGVVTWLLAGTAGAVDMVTVPVGNPGNAADTRYSNGLAVGSVNYAYNIGKYEVTAGQYTEFLNKVAKRDTYGLYNTSMWSDTYGCRIQRSGSSGNYTYSVASDWANRPVNWVSWGDAARFANWMRNGQPSGLQNASTTEDGSYYLNGANTTATLLAVTRKPNATWVIPTEDEWYKAAYHKNDGVTGNYFNEPTSSDTRPSNVLGNPTDPGNSATCYINGYTIGSPYWRTEVGAHENSTSPYGTFDQGGNVDEWNETLIVDLYRGLRGGSFGDSYTDTLRASFRDWIWPTNEMGFVGFRIALVPEPATVCLMALGAVALLSHRAKRRSR